MFDHQATGNIKHITFLNLTDIILIIIIILKRDIRFQENIKCILVKQMNSHIEKYSIYQVINYVIWYFVKINLHNIEKNLLYTHSTILQKDTK